MFCHHKTINQSEAKTCGHVGLPGRNVNSCDGDYGQITVLFHSFDFTRMVIFVF